ncbi:MAG: 4-hydroxy-tetrahydrodipicolinate reductase, partial [Duncaniella sp.]|nr:4-hydroxy-tetrahydrodipicolinate reductase [Duncaniella sp.]
MKIALIGYGKMGHAIERIARERGHEIVAVIDVHNSADIEGDAFRTADAAIEFTTPATAPDNVMRAAAAGVPVICGSTGWADRRSEVEQRVSEVGGALLASSNFSIGVNIFNIINRKLASLMSHLPQYKPRMYETHHIHKLDHPSGTAISLANGIIATNSRVKDWDEENPPAVADACGQLVLPISHMREGEVPGTHIISWDSPVDTITIEHKAKSRQGFALGAVVAAEWLKDKKGFL